MSLTYDPPQIALFYKRHANDNKKQLYIVQLNKLIFLGDPEQITEILFEQHSEYLSPNIISKNQVQRFVEMLLEFLQTQLREYEEQEEVEKSLTLEKH